MAMHKGLFVDLSAIIPVATDLAKTSVF